MTRIAILTPYAAPVPGGISTFVSGLSNALLKRGQSVSILAGEGEGDRKEFSNLGVRRAYVSHALRGLQEIRPEIIHCHSHWYCLATGVKYAQKNPGTRIVFSFHTTSIPVLKSRLVRLLRKAQVTTFVSAAQLSELRAALRLGGDLRILRPATPVTAVDSAEAWRWANRHGLSDAFPLLVFVGPLEYPRKVAGVIDLVTAFRHVRTVYPQARLLIVGDGSLRPLVEEAAADLGGSVTVTGFLADPRIVLANADLYCHISRQEGLPTALLEAMSLGRCVIGSRVGGIPEVLDSSNGVLVGPDPDVIGRVICDLLKDSSRRRELAMAAYETVERSYTWDARARQISSLYGLAG
jgi:glycosyltransferase involved in cell wall biosynthesis